MAMPPANCAWASDTSRATASKQDKIKAKEYLLKAAAQGNATAKGDPPDPTLGWRARRAGTVGVQASSPQKVTHWHISTFSAVHTG